MPRARQWISGMLLRSPASLRSIRSLPLVGGWVHRVSHAVLPADQQQWAQIQSGPAKGLWLELNPRTGDAYFRGHAEEAVQKLLAERLRPGMVFYDLGANIGLFSLLAARAVGPEGRVFSFEPDPAVVARLRRNVAKNGFANIAVVEAGVWSASGELNFIPAEARSPDRGTGRFVTGARDGTSLLKCVSLDDFIADHSIPDGIKCDVEGAEIEVVRGAEKLMRSRRPWILAEMHSDANARSWSDSLAGLGYTLEAVDAIHILAVP
jgi:FkbM family methyltransferase